MIFQYTEKTFCHFPYANAGGKFSSSFSLFGTVKPEHANFQSTVQS